jgi:hypothetical protein
MNLSTTKSSLSPNRRQLVEMMQRLNFGCIENLAIHAGDPTLSPAPRIVQDIKLDVDTVPRPELDREDFELKKSVVELFKHFDSLQDGTIAVVEVRYGLPFRITAERFGGELA